MIVLPLLPTWVHPVLESLAYFVGFRLFLRLRDQDPLSREQRSLVMGACILGAALGSKLTVWADNPLFYAQHWRDLTVLLPGKGIVGALVGGLMAVEGVKKCLHITQPTGDILVYPLMTALIIGRMGCFLAGLADQTYGTPTMLPWAVDFGDGIGRHPVQLYEITFLLLWMTLIHYRKRAAFLPGQMFQWWMAGYFAFRFGVEFLKPMVPLYGGLNSVQVLSIAMMVYYRRAFVSLLKPWQVLEVPEKQS